MARATRKHRSRSTRNYKAKRINRRGGGPLPPPTKIPQTPDMTVEVGAFDMTVPKSSLAIGFVYNNMGLGSDPGWEGWNPAWTTKKGGSRLPPLPQSPNMTVEVGAFNYTVPKSTLKPGTPYHTIGMELGSHVDPGWVGWNPEWSHPFHRGLGPNETAGVPNPKANAHRAAVQAATKAGNAARAEGANHNTAAARAIAAFTAQQQEANSSNNNSNSSSYMGEFAAEEAPAEAEAASAENNNDSTSEEERAENAGVNSFLSGGSRRRNNRKNSRKNRR